MDVATFQEILSSLPPQVQSYVLGALILFATIWLGLLGIRQTFIMFLGKPMPGDPEWKTKLFHVLGFLDALTPVELRALIELARKEQEIRKLNAEAPPKPRMATFPPPPDHDAGVEQ